MATVFDLLDGEWGQLSVSRSAARRLGDVLALAGGSGSLGDVERYVRAAEPVDADRVLLGLVARAVESDSLAARVLLQLLLPGTRNLARRWWALGDPEERAAAAVSAVYGRIRCYPIQRRPGRVAANILMDAARDLRRAVPRLVTTPTADPTVHPDRHRDVPAPSPAAVELAEVLSDAVADGVLEQDDASLIARSRIAGHRVADIARHHRLGTRALWDRRQRAEAHLATAYAS
jgi:hypothetical protein